MNRPALERAREMVRELQARGVKPAQDTSTGDRLNMKGWGYAGTCGTFGCLAGWMTLDPKLREMGLRNGADIGFSRGSLTPCFGHQSHDEALKNFLELGPGAVDYLFSAHNPNSWDAAYDRLTDVLEGRVK